VYLLDTTVWIDLLRTNSPSIRQRLSAHSKSVIGLSMLQVFYSVRSERMLIEQLQYNMLFRWFVGMEMDEAVWNHAVYSKNRERLLNEEIAESFFRRVLEYGQETVENSVEQLSFHCCHWQL
jgi:transposase